MKTMTVKEFQEALKAQGAPSMSQTCVVCPMCGTVQCGDDLIAAGAGKTFEDIEKYLGYSCVGRFTHQGDKGIAAKNAGKKWDRGCNWTLGGLFKTHELEVITPDGQKHPHFEPATPEQAQSHMKNTLGGS
jgi:hypothetical protein